MSLLGNAAMLLSFDVVPEAIPEHDDWHTHEHLPERLSIPGFRRGTRWVARQGHPRYLVLYEVTDLDTLASHAYLDRLNNPTPWTAKMMPHYRGMTRGLCSVLGSCGSGMGHAALLCRFKPLTDHESPLEAWLTREILPQLPLRQGLGSAHLLRGDLAPQMTKEQRIRGTDSGVDCALLITGYSQDAVAALARLDLHTDRLEEHGAAGVTTALYRMDYSLTPGEIDT